MTTEKVIKTLEYMREKAGLPDQGDKWSPNAETIALDEAIKAVKIVEKIPEVIRDMVGFRDAWSDPLILSTDQDKRFAYAKVVSWNKAIELVSELIKTEEN